MCSIKKNTRHIDNFTIPVFELNHLLLVSNRLKTSNHLIIIEEMCGMILVKHDEILPIIALKVVIQMNDKWHDTLPLLFDC